VVGSCEHDNDFSAPMKGRRFVDYLSDSQILTKLRGNCNVVVFP
jgi:hypothetical protein